MTTETVLARVAEQIAESTGVAFVVRQQRSVAGGCINRATVLQDGARRFFVKLNDAARVSMFAAEAEGLKEIARHRAVRVPEPVCWGTAGDTAYLVLEYLELAGVDARSLEQLGRQLAQMHRVTRDQFGWHLDNTIGSS